MQNLISKNLICIDRWRSNMKWPGVRYRPLTEEICNIRYKAKMVEIPYIVRNDTLFMFF